MYHNRVESHLRHGYSIFASCPAFAKAFSAIITNPATHYDDPEALAIPDTTIKTAGFKHPWRFKQTCEKHGILVFDDDWSLSRSKKVFPLERWFEIQDSLPSRSPLIKTETQRAEFPSGTALVDGVLIESAPAVSLNNLIVDSTSNLYWKSAAFSIQQKANASNGQEGCLPAEYYHHKKTGRLIGPGSAQNIHKDMRKALFAGYPEVDLQCCHWRILWNHYKGETISEYVQAPKEFLSSLSMDLGIPADDLKPALLSMVNRAAKSGPSMTKRLADKREAFFEHPKIINLRKDLNKASAEFCATGNTSKFSNTLMQTEQRIMRIVLEGSTVILPLHDGAILSAPIDVTAAEKRVHERTNYDVKLQQKTVECPSFEPINLLAA